MSRNTGMEPPKLSFIKLQVIWGLFICIGLKSSLHAQEDTVSHIWVEKGLSSPSQQQPEDQVFFKRMHLRRIPLRHPQNTSLVSGQASYNNQSIRGLVPHLIEGLRLGEIRGLMPENPRQAYDYFDLVFDMLHLQGSDLESLAGKVSREDIEWSWLQTELDLIVESGFDAHNSRDFFRIRFLRLIWHNPRDSRGRKAILLIPYAGARAWLEKLTCPLRGQSMSARELLELELFTSQELSIESDQSGAPQRMSPRQRSYGQTPDWWIN
ncbi:MAG: hypothetical protein AAFV07_13535 [Bacteroidota bacterium]